MRGLEIVREIGFLYEALNGIMHHHERIDGRGYPMGLAGHEIPEFARVIAVADAFDSMTSTRSYREAKSIDLAIGELRKGAGSQFDPLIVEAFIAALDVEEWPLPATGSAPADLTIVTVQDHDDPTAPLRVRDPVTGGTMAGRPAPDRMAYWQALDSGRLLLMAAAGDAGDRRVRRTRLWTLNAHPPVDLLGARAGVRRLHRVRRAAAARAAGRPGGGADRHGRRDVLRAAAGAAEARRGPRQSALLVIAVAAVGMTVGALPHIAAGRPAGMTGMCARLVAVACVAFIFRPLVLDDVREPAVGAGVRRSWRCWSCSAGWSTP